jgi:hypothetical protein
MGNFFSNEYLNFDRIIDDDNQIIIGIISPRDSNPLSTQGIKIGLNSNIYRLEKFIETNNSLTFEYEFGIILTLSRRSSQIIIHLKNPILNTYIIKPMDNKIRATFKPIMFGYYSFDYDKIPEFISFNLINTNKIESINSRIETDSKIKFKTNSEKESENKIKINELAEEILESIEEIIDHNNSQDNDNK